MTTQDKSQWRASDVLPAMASLSRGRRRSSSSSSDHPPEGTSQTGEDVPPSSELHPLPTAQLRSPQILRPRIRRCPLGALLRHRPPDKPPRLSSHTAPMTPPRTPRTADPSQRPACRSVLRCDAVTSANVRKVATKATLRFRTPGQRPILRATCVPLTIAGPTVSQSSSG